MSALVFFVSLNNREIMTDSRPEFRNRYDFRPLTEINFTVFLPYEGAPNIGALGRKLSKCRICNIGS